VSAVRRVVLAQDEQDAPVVVGPVFTDESVDRLREEIEERGWTNLGTAVIYSAAQFRALAGSVTR
jgi:hypothetical protein